MATYKTIGIPAISLELRNLRNLMHRVACVKELLVKEISSFLVVVVGLTS